LALRQAAFTTAQEKQQLVARLMDEKNRRGLTFQQIASHLQLTNLYVAQILLNQVQEIAIFVHEMDTEKVSATTEYMAGSTQSRDSGQPPKNSAVHQAR
jgi:cyanate lyase